MLTLIFQLIVAYVVFRLVRKLLLPSGAPQQRTQRPKRPDEAAPTVLSACPRCGTFFQETQGVAGPSGTYCSTRCRDGKP